MMKVAIQACMWCPLKKLAATRDSVERTNTAGRSEKKPSSQKYVRNEKEVRVPLYYLTYLIVSNKCKAVVPKYMYQV